VVEAVSAHQHPAGSAIHKQVGDLLAERAEQLLELFEEVRVMLGPGGRSVPLEELAQRSAYAKENLRRAIAAYRSVRP
jgi:hypothetical protein